jgi:hypothetical protein
MLWEWRAFADRPWTRSADEFEPLIPLPTVLSNSQTVTVPVSTRTHRRLTRSWSAARHQREQAPSINPIQNLTERKAEPLRGKT